MPPQRKEGHPVDWLKNDSGRTEVGQPRRNPYGHIGRQSAIDRLQSRSTGSATRDDHRLHAMLPADLGDVVNGAEDRETVHHVEPGLRDLDEAVHPISHPWAALQCSRECPSLVIGSSDQRHLACDRARIQHVRQAAGQQPAGDDRHKTEHGEQGDEVTRDVDARQERDHHDEKHGHQHPIEEALQLRGRVGRSAEVVEAVDREDHRPYGQREENARGDYGADRFESSAGHGVRDGLSKEAAHRHCEHVDDKRGHRQDQRPRARLRLDRHWWALTTGLACNSPTSSTAPASTSLQTPSWVRPEGTRSSASSTTALPFIADAVERQPPGAPAPRFRSLG